MNKKTFLIIGITACLVLAGIIVFMVIGRADEEPVPQMTEEQTIEDLTAEPDEGESGEVDLTDLNDEYIDEEEPLADTLEAALPALKEAGYNNTGHGYKATDNVDGVRSTRIITAKGNKVKADLTYDYGPDNENMIKFFKSDEDKAVSIMVSQYLTVLADRSTAQEGTLEYVIHVGGKKVKSGKMTLKEARELQEEDFGDY